jgi:transcriptional regulator with XRE-family HTH domain
MKKKNGTKSIFAKNLEKLLKERGLTQKSLASIAGVSPSTMNEYLNGNQPQNMSAVLKICESLQVDFQWLLTGENSRSNLKDISLAELFDMADEPDFSGIFQIELKRLKRKK